MTLWDAAIDTLLETEGGYVDDPRDAGGETHWGISKRSYPHLNIAELTRDDAVAIYERDYWQKAPTFLPDELRWMVFDACVQHGTRTALAWLDGHDTLASYTAYRLAFYAGLGGWPTFGRGWTRRVSTVLGRIDDWAREHGTVQTVPTAVFHGFRFADRWTALTREPIELRGEFVVRTRRGKVDVRREH